MDARTTPSHERPLRCTPRACHRPRTGETTTGNRRRGTTAPRAHGSDERRERSVHLRQGVPPHPQQSGVLFQALPRRPPALIGSRRLFGELVKRSLELRRAAAVSWIAAFPPACCPCAPRACGRIRSTAGAPDCSCVTSAPWVRAVARADLTQIQVDSTSWATPFFGSLQPATRQLWMRRRRNQRCPRRRLKSGNGC